MAHSSSFTIFHFFEGSNCWGSAIWTFKKVKTWKLWNLKTMRTLQQKKQPTTPKQYNCEVGRTDINTKAAHSDLRENQSHQCKTGGESSASYIKMTRDIDYQNWPILKKSFHNTEINWRKKWETSSFGQSALRETTKTGKRNQVPYLYTDFTHYSDTLYSWTE